ncbi:MAG: phosphoglucosamine mutase [Deltaproteobacteria bacterium]|nr:phosphoglucosamine mutase [Deltaproteobacteria bacterium]
MTRKLFGTDGVRGVANREPMTSEVALALGRAIAAISKSHHRRVIHPRVIHPRHRILIGKDTRLSGYMLETALASGICSMGTDVLLVGPLPTPAVAFLTRSMRADAGVVISASHNLYQDNGIKFFDAKGFKLPDEEELEIEKIVFNTDAKSPRPTADHIGKAFRVDDASGRYISYLKGLFPEGMTLEGIKVVLDCAHGAAYGVAPTILEELGAEVVRIGVTPNGTNINEGVGALYPEKMQETVKKEKAAIGIALDGDADRAVFCDERGDRVPGDAVLAILAKDLLDKGRLAQKGFVATVMSNLALEHLAQSWGCQLFKAAVGDRYVVEELRKRKLNFGGEQSGHIVFLDHATTGDGMLAAIRLLEIVVSSGRPVSELARILKPYPQVLINVKVREKKPFEEIAAVRDQAARVEKELSGKGRLLLRYSGTENLARVMIEGENEQKIQKLAEDLAGCLQKNLG